MMSTKQDGPQIHQPHKDNDRRPPISSQDQLGGSVYSRETYGFGKFR